MSSILGGTGGIELPPSLYNILNTTIAPITGVTGDLFTSLANMTASIPFGQQTLDIVQRLTSFLIPLAPRAPGAASMYQSNPSNTAAYAPPWWSNFASYVAMWGWPLLLKRIPGHGYRVLADTEKMEKGEYDLPAYMQGLNQPVIGG